MMEHRGTPAVTDMQVTPVARYDNILTTSSGAHVFWLTRNLAILRDSSGHTGIGGIHGGDYIREVPNSCPPLAVRQPVGRYRNILDIIHGNNIRVTEDGGEGIQTLDINKLKFVVRAERVTGCVLSDLLDQYLGSPMCELPGDGKQREQVETLRYLFHVSDKEKAVSAPPYTDGIEGSDAWFCLRRQEMLMPECIVEQAQILNEKCGSRNFELRGGVLRGEEEMEAIHALKKVFPEGRINIDPNEVWSLEETIYICRSVKRVLTYVEDPCGPEASHSSWETMAEFRDVANLPVAVNMVATNWR